MKNIGKQKQYVFLAMSMLILVIGSNLKAQNPPHKKLDLNTLHQFCATPDADVIKPPPEPARSSSPPEGWVDLPTAEELVGPLNEYSENIRPGCTIFYTYPKFFRDALGTLRNVDTIFVRSLDENWDYEVKTGIWQLFVRNDGTFQAQHEDDVFTYRLDDIGFGQGKSFRSLNLGEANWDNVAITGNTIQWENLYPNVDLKVRYIHHILKVEVIVREELIQQIRSKVNNSPILVNDFLTARFVIPHFLVQSEAYQGEEVHNLFDEPVSVHQTLRFVKEGKTIHKLRPVNVEIVDKNGKPADEDMGLIRTGQLWQLKENAPGIAEMSAHIGDLMDAPKGDVVIDPTTVFMAYWHITKDSELHQDSGTDRGGYQLMPLDYDDRAIFAFNISSMGNNRVITNAKLRTYVDENENTSDAQMRAYNVMASWSEAWVDWFDPWNNDGGDYTTTNQSPIATIPGNQEDFYLDFNVTDAFKARYPNFISDFIDKGFLIRFVNDPGNTVTFTAKELEDVNKLPRLEVEWAQVQSVTISPSDTKLYSPRQRTITATINPPVAGVTVNFEIIDPDDPADHTTIDASSNGNDNIGPAGSISSSNAITNSNGQASITFSTNSKVGGDNYIVRASVSETSADSPTMVVWRKLRIEYDSMEDTPIGYIDWGPQGNPLRNHTIHNNYLNGLYHGLNTIFADGSYQSNRCTFITPIVASSPPENKTSFEEYLSPSSSPTMYTYHSTNQTRDGSPYNEKLHMIVAHLHSSPTVRLVGGRACGTPSDCFYMYWDLNQYLVSDVDDGYRNDLWAIAHEIGHTLGRSHHNNHGDDDVAGQSGHDCIMTQDYLDPPSLNTNGQITKRFGPQCVRSLRNSTYFTLE